MKIYGLKRWIALGSILYLFWGWVAVHAESQKGKEEITVSQGNEVSLEYTLKLEDNAVFDTNVGAEPLTYTHGSHQIIPGLEKALEGMKIGESKHVSVKPEEGYGAVNPEAFLEIKKDQIPEDARKVGSQLQGQNPQGQAVRARVAEIKEQTVLLDFNHPLAGKNLLFDVKVLKIQAPPTK